MPAGAPGREVEGGGPEACGRVDPTQAVDGHHRALTHAVPTLDARDEHRSHNMERRRASGAGQADVVAEIGIKVPSGDPAEHDLLLAGRQPAGEDVGAKAAAEGLHPGDMDGGRAH